MNSWEFMTENEFPSSVFWTWYNPKNTTRTSFLRMCCFKRSLITRVGGGCQLDLEIRGSLCCEVGGGKGRHKEALYTIESMAFCPLSRSLDWSLSHLPRDFATMCLISCEFTGKAISQINGYKYSVWCVFIHVANFQFPLPVGIRIGWKSDNPKWCLSFLLSSFLPVVHTGSQIFIFAFSLVCIFYTRVLIPQK